MAPAWCIQCDSWERSLYAYGETNLSTGQVVTLAELVGRPGGPRRILITQKLFTASCAWCARCTSDAVSSDASYKGDKVERQHLLWKTFFPDHTPWWDSRRQKMRNPRPPDLMHKDPGDVFWLNNSYKPAWVDAQLAVLDARADLAELAPAASLSFNDADQLTGPGYKNCLTPEFVKKLCKQGQVKGAIEVLEILDEKSCGIDKSLLHYVLKACVAKKDLILGGQVHALASKMGFGSDTILCAHFIRMYAAHGRLLEAMNVFRRVALPDTVMWSSTISAHVKQGQAERAIELYQQMRAAGTKPDKYVFVAALQACAAAGDLQCGKQLHAQIEEHGSEPHVAVGGSLVNMYAKCGNVTDARIVFDGLREKNVVTWTAMISGYARQEGMGEEALTIYSAMRNEGMTVPDRVTYVCLLQACANVGVSALEKGRHLHSRIRGCGLEADIVLGGSLVNMYVKCGSLSDARIVFDGLREKDVVIWTAMISGYAQQEGMGREALNIYSAMHYEGVAVPDAVTYVCLLQACAHVGVSALGKGKQLHSQIKELGIESDVVLGGSLMNMYAKCGSLMDAKIVFNGLREKNVVTWNAMIAGCAQQEGMGQEALNIYSAMRDEGMTVPDRVTFVCLLQACANMGVSALEKGKQLHSQIKECGLESIKAVGGSLVNMYVKCGSLTNARTVFDGLCEKDVVVWTAMLSGYAQQEGMGQEALNIYSAMHNEGLAVPDAVTYVCLLQACAYVGVSALEKGKQLHSLINERGFDSDIAVGGSLVNMYSKCGSLVDARIVFEGLREKNVVTWNAMIAGYAQQEGMGQEALTIYSAMCNEGMAVPDPVTYVCLLQACASVCALQLGKELHSRIREEGLESDAAIGICLVNMYAQCGRLDTSRQVFDRLSMKSVESWNALINGCAEHGEGLMAIQCFEELLGQGIEPDDVTYILFVNSLQPCRAC